MNAGVRLLPLACLVLATLACAFVVVQPTPAPAATESTPKPATRRPSATAMPRVTLRPSPTSTAMPPSTPTSTAFPASDWKAWPVIPSVPETVRDIYLRGQALGNDPHAFSIFGDCQSEPEVFLGVYETDAEMIAELPPDLQETVAYFNGSFNRESPTVRGGTTAGALLWDQWHQGKYGCSFTETPVDCELRLHKPSFVIIHVGTHYEARNTDYLRRVIDELLAKGIVPIMATKADNREKDERIDRDIVMLAGEYNIPLWNFWAATVNLPDRGLFTRPDREYQGDIYLDDAAVAIHRLTALESLNAVWRAATTQY